MLVVAYNEDSAARDVAPADPEAGSLGGLQQGGLERIFDRSQDPRRRGVVGRADWLKSPAATPLKGFGGAAVLEVVVDFDGNTFRTVYTVRFAEAVYVLHAFQKKSRRAIATSKSELHLVAARLARAKEDYEAWLESR
jgi:Gp49-like protein DUF891